MTATEVPRSGARPAVARALAAAEVFALLLFVASRAAGYADQVDFHMADELGVVQAGRDLLRHGALPDIAYSPLTAVVYAALVALPTSAAPMDVMYWLVVLSTPVLLWWALRPLLPPPVGLLVAGWLGSSTCLLEAQCRGGMATPHVYASNAALLFVALGACLRRRPRLALFVLALAAVNRFEYAPWVLVFACALALSGRLGWAPRARWTVAVCGLLPMALAFGSEGVRGRSWAAFAQNYASTAVADDLRRADPAVTDAAVHRAQFRIYGNPWQRVAADFPRADSVFAALAENPRCFLAHVGRNLAGVPGLLAWAHGTTLLPRQAGAVLLAVLAALAAVGWWQRWRARSLGAGWPPALWLLMATSPCAVLVPLFVADRGELFWPLFPGWLLLLLGGLGAVAARLRPPSGSVWPSLAAVGALLALALGVPGPFAGPPGRLPNRCVRDLLTAQPPPQGARVVGAWPSYPQLLDRPDLQMLLPGHFEIAKFDAFLTPRPGDTIVIAPDLEDQVPDYRATVDFIARSAEWRASARRDDVVVYTRIVQGK